MISSSEPIAFRAPGFHTLLPPSLSSIPEFSSEMVLGSSSEPSGAGVQFSLVKERVCVPETTQL